MSFTKKVLETLESWQLRPADLFKRNESLHFWLPSGLNESVVQSAESKVFGQAREVRCRAASPSLSNISF